MPCNEDDSEESMNAPDPEPPCTPPKSTGNGGAGRVDPDGQMESNDDDSDAQQVAKRKRKWNGKMEWTLMKRWVTGEKAEMDQEDIDSIWKPQKVYNHGIYLVNTRHMTIYSIYLVYTRYIPVI